MGEDRGSATLMAVAFIAVIVSLTVGAGQYAAVVIARHRAQAAADLAALAAAGALPGGRAVACARAGEIVSAMRASLAQCRTDDLDAVVTVNVPVALRVPWLGSAGPAQSSARAGPVTG